MSEVVERDLQAASSDLDHDRYVAARAGAERVTRSIGEVPRTASARAQLVSALLIGARASERLGMNEEARALLSRAQDALRTLPDVLLQLEARVLEAMLAGSDGDVERAHTLLASVEDESSGLDRPGLTAWAVLRRGIAHSWRGEHQAALDCFDRAAIIELGAERSHRLPVIDNSIALTHLALGNLELALELFKDTLLSARAQKNAWAEGLVLVNMAELFFESGDLAHALDLYRQALAVARDIGAERLEGDALGWIGQIQQRLGDLKEAERHLLDAIAHHTAHRDGFQTAVATICLAEVALDGGRTNEAEKHAQAGLSAAERMDSGYLRARALLARARVARALGNVPAASADLQLAGSEAGRLGERRLEIWALRDLASLSRQPEERVARVEAALDLATDHGFEGDRVPLLLARAEALEAAGRLEIALVAYRDYVVARELQFDRDSDFRLRQQQVLYALEQAQHEAERHRQLSAELEAANRQLERLATTDSLTQVANRRHLMTRGQEEVGRARRYHRPLSVAMIDLDHFKPVNDTYGHEIGDQVLVAVAAVMQGALRENDILGRMGGEEFCVLLPDADLQEAAEVTERLRAAIAGTELSTSQAAVRITASFGVATFVVDDESFASALRRADRALYRAKAAGRNRVEISTTHFAAPSPRGGLH